jgi:hypothetical protein
MVFMWLEYCTGKLTVSAELGVRDVAVRNACYQHRTNTLAVVSGLVAYGCI